MPITFRMPAEWEPHEGTWIAWPHEQTDWPGKFEPVPWVYAEFVRLLSRVERVHILVNDAETADSARRMLTDAGARIKAVDFIECLTDRSWTRDYCPTFAKDAQNRTTILNWRFNGWAKYDNWQVDDAVPPFLAAHLGLAHVEPDWRGERIVLEGGAIDVNGAGSVLTTEECLLSDIQQRNPGLSRGDYEAIFARYLGARHTIWLRNGIAGDDTHGHIDDLARFVARDTVVLAVESDPQEDNYAPTHENLRLLQGATDQDGRPLRVVTLPMPEPVFFAGQRLPASYANFLIANGTVLVPTFNDANDRLALNTLAELFPDRRVVGIGSADLVLGLGTLHCMTQQQPA